MTGITGRVAVSILTFAISAPCAFAAADPGHPSTGGKSADQVAKELSNPAGSMTWKFELQAQYFAEQPETFGGDWQYKLTVTPVIFNPFVR